MEVYEQWRTGGGFKHPPPPKFLRPSKIVPNSTRLWKLLKIAEFRAPTPQDVRKKGSKILKLPPVRNCCTLAITNELVVIVNSFKVPKIKKILLYEMKFLVPNYSCLQNPWLGGYSPFCLSSVLNWICWIPPPSEQNSWVRHSLWKLHCIAITLPHYEATKSDPHPDRTTSEIRPIRVVSAADTTDTPSGKVWATFC